MDHGAFIGDAGVVGRDHHPRMAPKQAGFWGSGSGSKTSSEAAHRSPFIQCAEDIRFYMQSAAARIDQHRPGQPTILGQLGEQGPVENALRLIR